MRARAYRPATYSQARQARKAITRGILPVEAAAEEEDGGHLGDGVETCYQGLAPEQTTEHLSVVYTLATHIVLVAVETDSKLPNVD